jgi:hypothetical protein
MRGFSRYALVAELFAAIDHEHDADADANDENGGVLGKLRELCGGRLDAADESARAALEMGAYVAKLELKCVERGCGAAFFVPEGERRFLVEKGYSLPKRCRACRMEKKRAAAGKSPSPSPSASASPGRGRGRGRAAGASPGPGGRGRGAGTSPASTPSPSPLRPDATPFALSPPRTLRPPASAAKTTTDADDATRAMAELAMK